MPERPSQVIAECELTRCCRVSVSRAGRATVRSSSDASGVGLRAPLSPADLCPGQRGLLAARCSAPPQPARLDNRPELHRHSLRPEIAFRRAQAPARCDDDRGNVAPDAKPTEVLVMPAAYTGRAAGRQG